LEMEGVFRKQKEDEVSKYQKTSGQSYWSHGYYDLWHIATYDIS
jgi:hypothetical protein